MLEPVGPAVFSWDIGCSRRYQWLFGVINGVLAVFLFLLLPLTWAGLSLVALVLQSAWIARRHHALYGPNLRLELADGVLKQLRQCDDGSWLSQSVTIKDCNWLGSGVLAARLELAPEAGVRNFPKWFQRHWVALMPDNSRSVDRQRLAMLYHSGVAE